MTASPDLSQQRGLEIATLRDSAGETVKRLTSTNNKQTKSNLTACYVSSHSSVAPINMQKAAGWSFIAIGKSLCVHAGGVIGTFFLLFVGKKSTHLPIVVW